MQSESKILLIMKRILLIAGLALSLIPFGADAQGRGHGKGHEKARHKANKHWKKDRGHYGYAPAATNRRKGGGPPPWAPAHGYRAKQHVYFPDYYTYYDPRRNGYVYWRGNNWTFSRNVPSFLNGVNLGSARMQVLPLGWTALPETHYRDYARSYPANAVNISIPIPPL